MATLEARLKTLESKDTGIVEVYRTTTDGVTCNGRIMPAGFVLPAGCIRIIRSYGVQHGNT